ncbi:MAG: hypothetical protein Q9190_006474 [Brigantiaea leucoxantha]
MTSERESKTFLARLCEQAERYDEMVTYMKEVAKVSNTAESPFRSLPRIHQFSAFLTAL